MLLTIGPGGCGFTFLNWSISFLRGDTSYQTLDSVRHKISSNPLLGNTAHCYVKDHLRIEDSKNQFGSATEQSIIYTVPGNQTDFEYLLSLPGKKIIFDTSNYSKILMARAMIHIPKAVNVYSAMIDKISKTHNAQLVQEVLLDCHKFFMQYYQTPAELTTVYKIDYAGLFYQLDQELPAMFKYLQLNIDQSRVQDWQLVYKQYQKLNQQDFCAKLVPFPSGNTTEKTQILKEILKWRNGSSQTI
jgi:hypothetical protein